MACRVDGAVVVARLSGRCSRTRHFPPCWNRLPGEERMPAHSVYRQWQCAQRRGRSPTRPAKVGFAQSRYDATALVRRRCISLLSFAGSSRMRRVSKLSPQGDRRFESLHRRVCEPSPVGPQAITSSAVQVRNGLSAGGRRIRALIPATESSVAAPCTRRAASLRRLVAHPTVEQHAQRGDEAERLV
jgi:hypothetical protein